MRDACLARTKLPDNAIRLANVEKFVEETVSFQSDGNDGVTPPFPELEFLTQPNAILGSPQFMAPEQAVLTEVMSNCS